MPGTIAGGKKAARTNKIRYGETFYNDIGAAGGKASRGGGFAANRELAKIAGQKGGRKSKRRKQEEIDAAKLAEQAKLDKLDPLK